MDTALDGHGRKSVYCVETMGGKDRLLRLAKQAKNSEIILVSVMIELKKQREKKFLISGITESLSNTYRNVQKYNNTEKM